MVTDYLLGEGFVSLLCWSLVCWMLGVGWAAYRAVGWVERMRAWATSVTPDVTSPDAEPVVQPLGGPTCGGCSTASLGLNPGR